MNFKIAALVVLAITFLFQTSLEWLNMKSAERKIPDNVKDIYDEESYQKWLCYFKEKSRLSFFRHIVVYAVAFLVLGFDVYAVVVNCFSPANDYLAALCVLLADMLIGEVLSLPFQYKHDMGIEQKYGFNRMTKNTFAIDFLKNIVIGVLLTGGICCLFIWIHHALGNWLLLVFTVVMLLFVLLMVFIAPALGKIYNKFQPLPEGELREKLTRLLSDNDCTVKEIKVMDGSKRSTKADAYFSGFGKSKTIVLYDTLLEQMSDDEIVAVFAHEMGHNKHKDTLKMYVMNILNIVLFVLFAWALVSVPGIYKDFGFDGLNYGFAFYLLSSVCLSFLSPLLGLFTNMLSRRFEYSADRFAAENGYGDALISGLKKLSRNSFLCLTPHPLLVALEYSHPTVSERIAAIKGQKNNTRK